MGAAMHDAMTHGGRSLKPMAAAEQFEKFPDRRRVIGALTFVRGAGHRRA